MQEIRTSDATSHNDSRTVCFWARALFNAKKAQRKEFKYVIPRESVDIKQFMGQLIMSNSQKRMEII